VSKRTRKIDSKKRGGERKGFADINMEVKRRTRRRSPMADPKKEEIIGRRLHS